ncbi:MAG: CDP-glycerol glycerophosphotransferase family protein [Parachlamydiales bacterium]|nr:CDP-glycerol glycerophosphotransferase family protein [Parachlamydiales bacterium]
MEQRGDMQKGALLYGNHLHHLDHLAPLCHFLKIPLIIHDEKIYRLAQQQYVEVKFLYVPSTEVISFVMKEFESIISCFPRIVFEKEFLPYCPLKTLRTIWCPHGFSDKGIDTYLKKALAAERTILTYGNKGKKLLRDVAEKVLIVGNYRLGYFQKFSCFYEKIVQKMLPLNSRKKIVFFAPTWDYQNSLFSFGPSLLHSIPHEYHIVIKPHPNTFLHQDGWKIWSLEGQKNITLLEDFAPIYPLLQYSDIYCGDGSSIGYDFLHFNRPMFFFSDKISVHPSPLMTCGTLITPAHQNRLFFLMRKNMQTDRQKFSKIRRSLYNEVFAPPKELKKYVCF